MDLLRALLGIAFFCAVAWALSSERRRFPWRVVFFGLGLQVALGALILSTDFGRRFFEGITGGVQELIRRSAPASELVFGDLAKADGAAGFIFAFASSGLILIIVFSALMAVLYHLGVMQVLIWLLARVMTVTMGVSGAEAMAMAANIFVGQTEAPLVVKPYLPSMTRSELNALMTGGFATIAGSVLAVYMGILGPEIGPHLLSASVMSAPAAFVIAKIMQPETLKTETGSDVELRFDRTASNLVEAAANGTQDGLKLWLNVCAMLIAFVALVGLIDWPLDAIGNWLALEGGLSLARIFGWIFAPVAWLMGVEGWHDSQLFGSLLGTKVAINEFVAFSQMMELVQPAPDAMVATFHHERSAKMAAYALCGFANFGSVGIQIGGMSSLAPERKTDLAQLALRAMLGGAFASWMTATVAGVFLD
ncbi:MAG: nucleoside transporter C-terminal domain-containing protein [Planctomycetota bacterium]